MSLQLAPNQRSARMGPETLEFIPRETLIKPLKDRLLVAPLDVVHSRVIFVPAGNTKPLRGVVLAAGPGKYETKYDHPDKHKRTKMWESNTFIPTGVKVGETVELGGAEINGYAFEGFYWGDQYVIWCTARDVCGIVDTDSLDPGTAA